MIAPDFDLEMDLHRLDCLGSHGDLSHWEICKEFLAQLEDEPELPEPLVTGRDLIAAGLSPGPELGRWKDALLDRQLQDGSLTRDDQLAWLTERLARGEGPPPVPEA